MEDLSIFFIQPHLDNHPTMRTFSLTACFFVCAFATSACSGPIGPIAGGALQGNQKAWPQEWVFAEDCENVLLQTNSADPYSVTLWGVSVGKNFYVASSDQAAAWATNLASDPAVVLGIEGNLYTGLAERVTDPVEIGEVLEKYSLKYDFYLDEGDDAGGVIYRLNTKTE